MNDLKPQLAPGWSGVNIAILVVLFLIAKPLALLMLAYILLGQKAGLDLARPQTFVAAWERLLGAFKAGSASWGTGDTSGDIPAGGTPAPRLDRAEELAQREQKLAMEQAALERDRERYESEKSRTH